MSLPYQEIINESFCIEGDDPDMNIEGKFNFAKWDDGDIDIWFTTGHRWGDHVDLHFTSIPDLKEYVARLVALRDQVERAQAES
ncbi:hypothetical protein PBI_GRAYSON_184 [Rhodococcus phage Grayson]|nr:hypothetical protein PBI_GRAYSON_184 [Rhodococcus phage Grayson]